MNKVDILWDELRDPALVERTIDQQVSDTARTLEIDPRNVLPVSAQKGLAAKIKRDWVLLEKSGLLAVERKLTDEVIPARHLILQDYIVREMSGRIENSRGLIESRLATHVQQLAELRGLTGKNIDTIEQMVAHIRIEKHTYDRAVEGFEKTRAALAKQAATLLGYLNADRLDEFIRQTHMDMNESWTTAGLKHSMDQFFQEVHLRIEQAGHEADRIKQVVEAIYERLHQECGLPKLHPAMLSLLPFVVKATNLERKAEAFRNSPGMVMTERHFVVRKFFITLVGQARQTFRECDTASKRWFHDIISPLFMHIQQHRVAINSRLTELKQIHADVTSLNERIRVLETRTLQIEDERRVMDSLLERLHRPLT